MNGVSWPKDIRGMHEFFDVLTDINKELRYDSENKLQQLFRMRLKFMMEEMDELLTSKDPAEIVDAFIDICVVAIGTLDMFDVNVQEAWNEVMNANLKKKRGANQKRENNGWIPDLVKPEGWTAPDHSNNLGHFPRIFKGKDENINP